jgi:hypothetical protein
MQPPTAEALPEYNRDDWGRWEDADRDCQDTRQEVLIAESLDPVQLDERGCKVLSGRWIGPYTGKEFTDPGLLDIDHVVPLLEAHLSGGYAWTPEKKEQYFNSLDNPAHLRAVDRSANRSKGAKQPHEWLPEKNVCQYLQDWVTIKVAWSLEYDCEEAQQLANLLVEHCR